MGSRRGVAGPGGGLRADRSVLLPQRDPPRHPEHADAFPEYWVVLAAVERRTVNGARKPPDFGEQRVKPLGWTVINPPGRVKDRLIRPSSDRPN